MRTELTPRQRRLGMNMLSALKIEHRRVSHLLDAYSTHELTQPQTAQVEHHLLGCSLCQQSLIDVSQLHQLLSRDLSQFISGEAALPTMAPAHPSTTLLSVAHDHEESDTLNESSIQRTSVIHTAHQQTLRKRVLPIVATFLLMASSFAVFHAMDGRGSTTPTSHPGPSTGKKGLVATATVKGNPPEVAHGWTLQSKLPGASAVSGIIPSIAWSVADPNTLFLCRTALTFPARTPGNSGSTLLRSDDRGQTWHQLTPPEPTGSCMVQMDPALQGQVIVQDDHGGAFVSRDNGVHWDAIPAPPHAATYVDQAAPIVIDHGRIFYGAYSTDDLKSWQLWDAADNGQSPDAFAIDPGQVNLLYRLTGNCSDTSGLAGSTGDYQYGVCVSHDGGQTWQMQLALALSPGDQPSLCTVPSVNNLLYVWVPAGTKGGKAAGLYVSRDAGASWTIMPLYMADSGMPLPPPDAPCSAARSLQIRAYVFTDAGQLLHLGEHQVDRSGQPAIPAGVSLNSSTAWKVIASYPADTSTSEPLTLFALPQIPGHAADVFVLSPTRLLKANQKLE